MMTWDALVSNWTAAQQMAHARFRWLEEDALRLVQADMAKFAEHLAATHDLTLAEAREEVENWLMTVARAEARKAA